MIYLIGSRYMNDLAGPLDRLGAAVSWLPDAPELDSRLAGHADLQIFAANGQAVVGAGIPYHIVNILTNRGCSIQTSISQGPDYPADVGLCICDTGRYLLYNPRTAAPQAVALSHSHRIPVAQGYTRCAVCIVTERAVITADHGIVRAVSNNNIE